MDVQIKSATRVIRIFEFFDRRQREAGVMDVARALDLPQSSTSLLLKSLVAMGYLNHDAPRRAYSPTPKLTRLGAWVEPLPTPDAAIVAAMEEVGAATGGTVILGMPLGDSVRYIHVVPATTALRLHLTVGTARPMALSGMGRLFMSQMQAGRVREIIQQHNAAARENAPQLTLAEVRRDLAAIRRQKYSVSLARITQGAGVVAVRLAAPPGTTPMALGIGAPIRNVQEAHADWVALMRAATARHRRG